MPRRLHLDPFSGVSGDMLLAALVDLGSPQAPIQEALEGVPFPGVTAVQLRFHDVRQHGVRGFRLEIVLDPPPQEESSSYEQLRASVSAAALPAGARQRALNALDAIARAESQAQGIGLDEIRFHELGGYDTVVDLVGVAVALELLRVESISSGPLPIAGGEVRTAHGTIPSPAPATLELLKDLPTVGLDAPLELVTPTGVGLARTLASSFGPPPSMMLRAVGVGFGQGTLPKRPNCLRVLLGDTEAEGVVRESLLLLETNLDDLPSEVLATLIETCLAAGALDAWLTPALMKKGRPGHVLSALCEYSAADAVEQTMFRHSSTLGVRRTGVERDALTRTWENVETPWGPVRVKLGMLGRKLVNRAPEFEDCRRVAEKAGIPLKDVYAAALSAMFSR